LAGPTGPSGCADEVILSRKGANSPTRLRPTGTKVRTRVGRMHKPGADLEQQLEEYRRELAEAREQQRATSEVLRIISSSPGELEPVFEAMLANATRLCEARFGVLFRSEADALRAVALHDAPPLFAEERRRNPVIRLSPDSTLGRAVATKQTVQIADVQDDNKLKRELKG
jgi:hypothetical protein